MVSELVVGSYNKDDEMIYPGLVNLNDILNNIRLALQDNSDFLREVDAILDSA